MKAILRFFKSKDFVVSFICGAVIAVGIIMITDRQLGLVSALCDGFFVAGVLILGSGGLKFVRNQGQFDLITYGVSHWFTNRWNGLSPMSQEHRNEDLAEYKERKREERKSPLGLVVAGAIYLVLAGIMLLFYYA